MKKYIFLPGGVLVVVAGVHQAFILSPLAMLMPEREGDAQRAYIAALERCHGLAIGPHGPAAPRIIAYLPGLPTARPPA